MSVTTAVSPSNRLSAEESVLMKVCQGVLYLNQHILDDKLATPKQIIEGTMMAVARIAEVAGMKVITAELLESWATDLRAGDEIFPRVDGSA